MESKQIRLIDREGKLVGIMPYHEALLKAQEQQLDLVEISAKANPPVYKLGDASKIKYEKEKKLKAQKLKERQAAPKILRIGFNEGTHDLMIKSKKIEEFLNENRIVTIEMRLRGREKAHFDLAKTKMENFLKLISLPYKIIQPIQRSPQGFLVSLKKN